MRNYVSRVAPTKEALKDKGSIHMVHGIDVARAIIALSKDFTDGERWALTDGRVYDCMYTIAPQSCLLIRFSA